MLTLPYYNKKTKEVGAPHIVILGAGASRAAFPKGDKQGIRFPLMDDFIEIVGLGKLLRENGVDWEKINFEDFYDDLFSAGKEMELQKSIEHKVYEYFDDMIITDEATIYDYLILSLRKKDLIVTFNWDPMLVQAYKRNIFLKELPRIHFLHGNVGIGVCVNDKKCGYIEQKCSKCGNQFQRVRLLYPVKHKDYESDSFIKNEWDVLRKYLSKAYFITIFGYNAPKTDIAAKEIMLEMWGQNKSRELAQIEMIDIKSENELLDTWNEFIVEHHYFIANDIKKSFLWSHPRRTCDAFFGQNMEMEPWKDNPFPDTTDLYQLQRWSGELIKEEKDVETKGFPFKIE